MEARNDDNVFSDFISACSSSSSAVNEDRIHNKLPQSVREFLKKKFGTIARFYSGISVADTTDVNGFSRIKELRRALSALDRGGWERSYHQKLFHVSISKCGSCWHFVVVIHDHMADTALFVVTGIVFEFGGTGDVQNGSTWLFRKIVSAAAGNEQLVHHQPRNLVRRPAVFRLARTRSQALGKLSFQPPRVWNFDISVPTQN